MEDELYRACFDGDWSTFQDLVNNDANINFVDERGDTYLHHASRGGNMKIVQYLVENGLNINKRNDKGELHQKKGI